MAAELKYPATWEGEDFNKVRQEAEVTTSNHFELSGEGFNKIRERVSKTIAAELTGENF